MNKTSQSNAWQGLHARQLTPDEIAEMKFNFINYIETLIEMDNQRKERLEEKRMLPGRDKGEKGVETHENLSQEDVSCTT